MRKDASALALQSGLNPDSPIHLPSRIQSVFNPDSDDSIGFRGGVATVKRVRKCISYQKLC